MGRDAIAAKTMRVGKKGGGKHWTAAEVAERKKAAENLERKDKKEIVPPKWLSKEALKIWDLKMSDAEGVELLDTLDREAIAIFCDTAVKYEKISKKHFLTVDDYKLLQGYSRIIAQFSNFLGFNPIARQKLILARANKQKERDLFSETFD